MMNRLLGGPVGLLIGVAAAISLVFGVFTYVVQSRGNSNSTASVELRLHDEVVSWPNHSALQREAVAEVNDEGGQSEIRAASGSGLISVEAKSLGDPASVQVVAVANDDSTALAAVEVAADRAINQSILDRAAPIEAQLLALRADLAEAVRERDALLSELANGIEDDGERAIATASVESIAGVASVLEQDAARLEADLNARAAPLVRIGDAQLSDSAANAFGSALAAAAGALFLSLLGLSLIRDRAVAAEANRTIDLTDGGDKAESGQTAVRPERLPASVE